MKYMLYLSVLTLLFACSKSKDTGNRTTLEGNWKLTATALSIGGPMQEYPADVNKPVVVAFKTDGSYISNAPENKYTKFLVSGDNKVTLTGPGATTTTFQFSIAANTLKIWPTDPICIEGCYTKYVAVK